MDLSDLKSDRDRAGALPETPQATGRALATPHLAIVIPTFNERENVEELIRRLDAALPGVSWEAIFVDDNSPDGTSDLVRQIARTDSRVRCLRRIGRRGLSGACIEGILSASAPVACVMDADLQHDETQIAKMLAAIDTENADLVIGSRYIAGGSSESFNATRQTISSGATRMTQRLLSIDASDPMSGFFMIRRDRFEELAPSLSTQGFKILLDILATSRGNLRIVEVPFVFGTRLFGESKLDTMVALDFAGLLLAKMSNDLLSLRFVLFGLVGAVGLIVHLAALYMFLTFFDFGFDASQTLAAFVAMTSNFLLNNRLTYRDQRLRGSQMVKGLLKFYAVSSVGLAANVGVAFVLYDRNPVWWFAGAAGSIMAVIWNYSMSTLLIWRRR